MLTFVIPLLPPPFRYRATPAKGWCRGLETHEVCAVNEPEKFTLQRLR